MNKLSDCLSLQNQIQNTCDITNLGAGSSGEYQENLINKHVGNLCNGLEFCYVIIMFVHVRMFFLVID